MFKKNVKCLMCSKLYNVSKKDFEEAQKTADKETKILNLVCPACKDTKASAVNSVSFFKKTMMQIGITGSDIWDKITDVLAWLLVYWLKFWSFWQYDIMAVIRQFLTYFVIFLSAYLVVVYSPLKSYLLAIIAILIITLFQTFQRR